MHSPSIPKEVGGASGGGGRGVFYRPFGGIPHGLQENMSLPPQDCPCGLKPFCRSCDPGGHLGRVPVEGAGSVWFMTYGCVCSSPSPRRKHLEAQPFSFCSAGRWASGIRVHEDGQGLREAWCRQLQQFSRVSPTVAEAVAREYPSPPLLLQVS